MSERLTPFPAADQIVTDDLDLLLGALPPRVSEALSERESRVDLLEVVLDLGRLPEARYPGREVVLSHEEVTEDDLEFVIEHIGDFGADNRAGIERTLHRISCIRNRRGKIVGLTCRIGRAVYGTIRVIEDLVLSDRSILFLGRPGVGKTTMLREVARVLADDANKRVIIVDTSNEIAGDGDIPHPAIGSARRMQVPTPALQHAVMIEAVENHMPEVIVIDEIGTELEAAAARTIAERGVQLVGTAHGNSLENLMLNPTLSDLIGGIQSVTLGDEEARRRGTQKSILERKAPPTFDVVVEIQNWARVAVHGDVAATIDARLRGYEALPEIRQLNDDGEIEFLEAEREDDADADFGHFERGNRSAGTGRGPSPTLELGLSRPGTRRDFGEREPRDSREPRELRADRGGSRVAPPESASGPSTKLYAFGISRQRLEQAIQQTGANVQLVPDIREADAAITLRSYYRRKPAAIREAEERAVPIYVLKTNTAFQVEQVLNQFRGKQGIRTDPMTEVFRETEDAVAQVMREGSSVDLNPQNSYIRRLQHQIVGRYNLESKSAGKEPQRHVRILPLGAAPYASGED